MDSNSDCLNAPGDPQRKRRRYLKNSGLMERIITASNLLKSAGYLFSRRFPQKKTQMFAEFRLNGKNYQRN
jgi:hypothetical protein